MIRGQGRLTVDDLGSSGITKSGFYRRDQTVSGVVRETHCVSGRTSKYYGRSGGTVNSKTTLMLIYFGKFCGHDRYVFDPR